MGITSRILTSSLLLMSQKRESAGLDGGVLLKPSRCRATPCFLMFASRLNRL